MDLDFAMLLGWFVLWFTVDGITGVIRHRNACQAIRHMDIDPNEVEYVDVSKNGSIEIRYKEKEDYHA